MIYGTFRVGGEYDAHPSVIWLFLAITQTSGQIVIEKMDDTRTKQQEINRYSALINGQAGWMAMSIYA
jgi:hypothetical protein